MKSQVSEAWLAKARDHCGIWFHAVDLEEIQIGKQTMPGWQHIFAAWANAVQKISCRFGSRNPHRPTPNATPEAGCGTLQTFCCGKTAQTLCADSRRRVTPTHLVCMEAPWNALVFTCKVVFPCRRLGTLNSRTTVARVVLRGPSVFVCKFKKPLTSPQPPHQITSQTMEKWKIARRCHGFQSWQKHVKTSCTLTAKVPTLIISSVANTLPKSQVCLVEEMSTWQLWLAVTLVSTKNAQFSALQWSKC